MARRIHPTAIVSPRAEIGDDVVIGPYVVIEAGVRMGTRNVIHPFAVIGGDPQIRKTSGAANKRGDLLIGDDNVIREHVTINVSTGSRTTTIGSNNLLMTGCHVAHDVVIGSSCVVANGVQLAGHVTVEDWVTFGGLAAIQQFVRVAESAFFAGGAMCERDVPPFVIVQGDRARVRALNVIGLERRGVPAESIAALKRAVAALFPRSRGNRTFADALAALDRSDPFVARLAGALSVA
jgi:UDP-N-acetylglucosamine acyltransferase